MASEATHAAAALDCEARRCWGRTAGDHMRRGAETIRAQQARLDAALAVVAELQGEADNPWEVDALDRIERALRGDS